MQFSNYETIKFARRGRVLEVIFNRPDELNAVNAQLHEEMARVFVDVNNDPDSDVIVLTGAGRAFSAGGDIEGMRRAFDGPSTFHKIAREGKQIIFSLLDCEKPIVAKVNGHAMGLGATVALFCDVIFATEAARIGLINHAVPAAELDERVNQFSDRLASGPSKAIRWSKVSVNI